MTARFPVVDNYLGGDLDPCLRLIGAITRRALLDLYGACCVPLDSADLATAKRWIDKDVYEVLDANTSSDISEGVRFWIEQVKQGKANIKNERNFVYKVKNASNDRLY